MDIGGLFRGGRRADAQAIAQYMERIKGQGILRSADDIRFKTEGTGQIAIAGFGDFISNLLPATLETVARAGAESYMNDIYLGQAANDLRTQCIRNMPSQFRDQVTELVVPAYPDGFGGASAEEMWDARKWWLPELQSTLTAWGDRLHTNTAVTGSFSSILWMPLSVNGHRLFGPYAMREYLRRNPRGEVYALLPFPVRSAVRDSLPEVYDEFGNEQPRGYIAVENLGDQARANFGLVQLLAAQVVGNWIGGGQQRGESGLNGINAIFPKKERGSTGTISVFASTVPVFRVAPYKDKVLETYYTNFALLEHEIIQGIETVLDDETLQSVPLRKSKKGSARSLIVIAPVVPECLRQLANRVDERIGSMLRARDVNLTLQYASIGQPLTPGGTAVVSFILLQTLEATRSQLSDYVQGRVSGNPAVLPHARNGSAPNVRLDARARQLQARDIKRLESKKKEKKA